jgi:hypothetical protein
MINKNASSGFLGLRILFFPSGPTITTERVNATIIRQTARQTASLSLGWLGKSEIILSTLA